MSIPPPKKPHIGSDAGSNSSSTKTERGTQKICKNLLSVLSEIYFTHISHFIFNFHYLS